MELAIAQTMPKLKNVNGGVYLARFLLLSHLRMIIILRMRIIINYPTCEWVAIAGGKFGTPIAYILYNFNIV